MNNMFANYKEDIKYLDERLDENLSMRNMFTKIKGVYFLATISILACNLLAFTVVNSGIDKTLAITFAIWWTFGFIALMWLSMTIDNVIKYDYIIKGMIKMSNGEKLRLTERVK